MYRKPRALSGTAVAVCEPQPLGAPASLPVEAMRSWRLNTGLAGSEMSKMWMPSKPVADELAGARRARGVRAGLASQERIRMFS